MTPELEELANKIDRLLRLAPALETLNTLLIEADYVTKAKRLNKKTISENDKLEKYKQLGGHRKILLTIESVPVIRDRKGRYAKAARR